MNGDLVIHSANGVDWVINPALQGAFTRAEQGDWKNGWRVEKTAGEAGDATQAGVQGTILGSLKDSDLGELYFIVWDDKLDKVIAVGRIKLKVVAT